jgi:tetratricopeptide (TPR) repeat protein
VVINNYVTADADSEGSDASATASPTVSADVEQSFSDFDRGTDAFKAGDYRAALEALTAALLKNGSDPVIHEVRALAQFALGDYPNAAATLNALLASAPGMDWTTMSSLYGNADDYTKQLRKLEEFCKTNPKNAASAFVLAYHYLVLGSKDSAIRALKVVVDNQPKDVTARRMLEALQPVQVDPAPASDTKPSAEPTAEELAKPQPETDLVGTWTATNASTTIELAITEESSFTWKVTDDGKVLAELSGDLATNGDQVVLDTKEQGSLGGTVKSLGPDNWMIIPPGVTDLKNAIKFSRVKK